MKKFNKILLAVIVLIAASIYPAKAAYYDFKVGNLYYKIESINERTCAVCIPLAFGEYQGSIVIPRTVTYNNATFTVVAIDEDAFRNCPITSVVVPNSVIEIKNCAFCDCKNLKSVKLPDSLKIINAGTFRRCFSLNTINIPKNVVGIYDAAFQDCDEIKETLVIPASCQFIGPGAFYFDEGNIIIEDGDKPLCLYSHCFDFGKSIYIGRSIIGPGNNALEDHHYSGLYRFNEIKIGDNVSSLPKDRAQPLYYGTTEHKIDIMRIGYNLHKIEELNADILKAVYVNNPDPSFLSFEFSNKTYISATLYVPRGSKSNYKNSPTWKSFINIQEYDAQISPTIQARIKAEQERKEQLRRQEEQNRLKEQQLKEMPKRLPEIEKLVDLGSKRRLWSQSKFPEYLQYYRQIPKNSYMERFRLSLKFTKEGNLYMWSEISDKFEELFHAMKLEGTIQQWESGHWTIDLSSSNQEIAKSINYILDQMAAAENSYRMKLWKSPQYEKEFQRSKNELSSILSHPLGNRNLNWMEPKKEFIKSIKSLYPELQIKKSNIYGRIANQKPFFRFGTNTNDRLKLDIVDIDLNKSKDGPIIVKYKLTTNSSKKDFGADYRIKMVLQDYMGFKCDYSTNEYAGEVNGIKIESLKIDKLDDSCIELSFSVPREGKDATSTGKKEELAKKERERNNVNGHIAVDMGLSVRWADCNIGANHHYETGDYYAWGETSTKVSFPWNTYKHISNGKLIKYCSNSSSGRVDNKRILETQDDAAYVNWGNAWRIPTKEQWEELADNNKCKWEWTTDSGVYGYKVTSKITGNSIFLPVTGYKPGGTRIEHPELGLYWTSTLFTEQYDNGYLAAYRFDLGQTHYNCRGTHRCNGRAIRAVCK